MLPAGLKPGQSPAAGAKFVICEICDGYIKDLEQLRNHMQWMHKVKVSIFLIDLMFLETNGTFISDSPEDDLQ